MSDAALTISPGADVYDHTTGRYIGTIVRVSHAPVSTATDNKAERTQSGIPHQDTPLVHEEGNVVGHADARGERMLGEEMGPVPTIASGNHGPINQSAGHDYATRVTLRNPDVIAFNVRPGRINLGPLTPTITIPTSAVVTLSMDRVTVDRSR